jgi:CBS domain containing-hemolysin-like protein
VAARGLARGVLVVPENRALDGILADLQKQEIQMVVAIDERGSFKGLFTMEDIIEEIVGEIRDEFDDENPPVRELPDGSYAIDGRLALSDANEAPGTDFESEDFDTIGGHLLRVEETDGPRVAALIAREAPEEVSRQRTPFQPTP